MSFLNPVDASPFENLFSCRCNLCKLELLAEISRSPFVQPTDSQLKSAPGILRAHMVQYCRQIRQDGLARKSVCKFTSEKNRSSTDLAPIINAIAHRLEIILALVGIEQP